MSHTTSPTPTTPPPHPARHRTALVWAAALGLLLAAGLLVLSLCVPALSGPLQVSIAGVALYTALVRPLFRRRRQ